MSLGQALAVVGQVVGAQYGPIGSAIGSFVGQTIGDAIDPQTLPTQYGPKLNDLKVQTSAYGINIPRIYGMYRVAGNVIWATPLVQHENSTEQGGKGGGPTQTTVTYSYTANCAIAICEGPIGGVRRIWANGNLIYDISADNTGPTGESLNIRIYPGDETQDPDPFIESVQGVGATPAYRGLAYVVFEEFALADYGNYIPNFTFEVFQRAEVLPPMTSLIGPGSYFAIDPENGNIWTTTPDGVKVYSSLGAELAVIPYINDPLGVPIQGSDIAYCAPSRKFFVVTSTMSYLQYDAMMIDADDFSLREPLEYASGLLWHPARIVPVTFLTDLIVYGGDYVLSAGALGLDSNGVPNYDLPAGNVDWAVLGGAISWGTGVAVSTWGSLKIWDLTLLASLEVSTTSYHSFCYDSNRQWVWLWERQPPYRLRAFPTDGGAPRFNLLPNEEFSDTPAFPGFTFNSCIVYDSKRDCLWYVQGDAAGKLVRYELQTNTIAAEYDITGHGIQQSASVENYYDEANDRLIIASNTELWTIHLGSGLLPGTITLGEIVTDCCGQVGMEPSDIDVSDLTETVDGFFISRRGPIRQAIDLLSGAYLFDACESDGKLKFFHRGGPVIRTIPADDLAAFESGDPPAIVTGERAQDLELPARIDLSYSRAKSDYQSSTQFARRETAAGDEAMTVELPLVLEDSQARHIAQTMMIERWLGRQTVKWQTTRKHADLDPGDVVALPFGNAGTQSVRITRRDESRMGLILWEGVAYDQSAYTAFGTAYGGLDTAQSGIVVLVSSDGVLLDLPALRDQDGADAGFYWAVSPSGDGRWPGAVLVKSADSGASYSQVASSDQQTVIGTVAGTLAAGPTHIPDEGNQITVHVDAGTLSSTNREGLLNGLNAAVVGGEILQFRTAMLTGTNTYVLSGLLRGRKGTEAAVATHGPGETFVLLRTAGVTRIAGQLSEIGSPRLYKSVTSGQLLTAVAAQSFAATGRGLKPYSPVQLAGGRNAAGDVLATWRRRGRLANELLDGADVPLSEESERYELEIWDAGYMTLKRTVSGLTSASYIYAAADQATDFGGLQSAVHYRIYQLSAVVGRGDYLEGTV